MEKFLDFLSMFFEVDSVYFSTEKQELRLTVRAVDRANNKEFFSETFSLENSLEDLVKGVARLHKEVEDYESEESFRNFSSRLESEEE